MPCAPSETRSNRCFERRADALFELGDAILTAEAASSPVHLSLEPSHRRGWGSLYAALNRGRIDAAALRGLLDRHPLAAATGGEPPVYAVDVSVWPRCDAESSPERGYYYHPSRHSAGQPIVASWAYQWIAQIGFVRESWTAPMDAQRVHPMQNANAAADQVKALLDRSSPEEAVVVPLFVFDAGYDPVRVQQGLAGRQFQILVRLRAGRAFYADPTGLPAPTGRSRRHGRKYDCKDPASWPEPSAEHACEDGGYGKVRVRAWAGLHPKVQAHAGRGSRGPTPIVRPDYSQERQRHASKGGKRGGRGRPSSELARLQERFEELAEQVLSGEVERGVGAVAAQLLNGARACTATRLKAIEQEDILARVEELESIVEHQNEYRRQAW